MAFKNKEERIENVEVDINDTSLAEGQESELDLKEDWQARSAPPPGRMELNKPKLYKVRAFIEDTSFEQGSKYGFKPNDPNGKYYKKSLTLKIQDPTGVWQDSTVFYNLSTGIPKGKKISSMAGFLQMIKVKVPVKCTDLYLSRLLVKAMEKLDGPVVIADCDWSAWDSTASKRGSDFGSQAVLSNGKIASSMANFPRNTDGSFNHIAYTKGGLEVVAKLKVLRLLAPVPAKKEEDAKVQTAAIGAATKPPETKPATQSKPAVPEELVIDTGNLLMADDGEVILEG